MRINFVLPRPAVKIVGGFRIVYEYANHLAECGHDVIITYDCSEIGTRFHLKFRNIKRVLGVLLFKKAKWFSLDKRIKIKFVASENDRNLSKADIIIATAVNTVNTVWRADSRRGKKVYFIQGMESFIKPIEEVQQTYRLFMNRITVSRWLYDLVKENIEDDRIFYCRNGIDTQRYTIINPIENRYDKSIAFMYHTDKVKGMRYTLQLIERLKASYGDIRIYAFGAFDRPEELGKEVDYYSYADSSTVIQIYNNAAIFVCTSIEEGFGLTGAESMACGCALVSTETNGSREYADNTNALLSEPRDVNQMYKNIVTLFDNPSLRIRLAKEGRKSIEKFSKVNSEQRFEQILLEIHNEKMNEQN